jgi:hypothetical protein
MIKFSVGFALIFLVAGVTVEEVYESKADPLDYLFHAAPANLLFCRLAKSASTPSMRFVLRIVGDPLWNTTMVHQNNLATVAQMRPSDRSSLFANPQVTRAVVARDPIERFASGFIDKCVKRHDFNCPVQGPGQTDVDAVLTALESTGVSSAACNGHFRTAASVCLLNETLHDFLLVPYVDLAGGWARVVRHLKGIDEKKRRSFWDWARQAFDPKYEKNRRIVRATAAHRTNSSDLASEWRQQAAEGDAKAASIILRLQKLYASDYALFAGVRGVVPVGTLDELGGKAP